MGHTANSYRSHTCGELRMEHVGQTVRLAGFLENLREVGSSFAFAVLRDFYGVTQLVIENEETLRMFKDLNKESTLAVEGVVRERDSKNPKLPTGDVEVVPARVEVLGRCRHNELPFQVNRSREADESARLKYRYLDLRNPAVKRNIILRCHVVSALRRAMTAGDILESRALSFDSEKRLHFRLGEIEAIMPYEECADGVREGAVRDMLLPGDILPCRVTHLESFGAFCDIGCGVPALLPIDCMSVSRIQSPADRVHEGQDILCAVKSRDTEGRIVLTMKELLGTWLENAAAFAAGETVVGLVRSVEPYGVFVELAPNLAGLAEAAPGLDCGQLVSVYIKSIIPEKMKIKLVVLHAMRDETFAFPLEYRLHAGHIGRWIYSVPGAARVIETIFDG